MIPWAEGGAPGNDGEDFYWTLLYLALTLRQCGGGWVSPSDFIAGWHAVAPPTFPVWGMGCSNPTAFALFLYNVGYIVQRYDEEGICYVRSTAGLRNWLAHVRPETLMQPELL